MQVSNPLKGSRLLKLLIVPFFLNMLWEKDVSDRQYAHKAENLNADEKIYEVLLQKIPIVLKVNAKLKMHHDQKLLTSAHESFCRHAWWSRLLGL
jgi:hypothetical protein